MATFNEETMQIEGEEGELPDYIPGFDDGEELSEEEF